MRSAWLLPFVTCFVSLTGCGIGYNEKTGGDAGRGDAQAVKTDALSYDRISSPDGDHTDWKTFKLEGAAAVSINVWWDDPKSVSASVELRDQFGKSMGKLSHKKGERKETLGPFKVPEGSYFLQFEATDGASVYSFEIITGAGGSTNELPDL